MRPERTLRSITGLIVRCCNPEEVLLFGSYAKEQATPESDLDILVIGDFRQSPFLRGQEVRELLRRYPIRVDLHLMTPGEVAEELRKPYGFVSSVLANSVVLYKKGGEMIDKARFSVIG